MPSTHRPILFAPALLLFACASDLPAEHDDDDGGIQCGTTYGFVYGVVTGPDGETPQPDALVQAVHGTEDSETWVDAELAGDGSYELNVPGDQDWTVRAWVPEGCASDDHGLYVAACTETQLDLVCQ